MADEPPIQIPPGAILSDQAIAVGVAALERIHGHHLSEMSPDEQAQARAHWRHQVQEVLGEVSRLYGAPAEGGRAILWLADAADGTIDVSVSLYPELREIADDQVEGTPAQIVALRAFQAATSDTGPAAGE